MHWPSAYAQHKCKKNARIKKNMVSCCKSNNGKTHNAMAQCLCVKRMQKCKTRNNIVSWRNSGKTAMHLPAQCLCAKQIQRQLHTANVFNGLPNFLLPNSCNLHFHPLQHCHNNTSTTTFPTSQGHTMFTIRCPQHHVHIYTQQILPFSFYCDMSCLYTG